jgi:hypothetical protein
VYDIKNYVPGVGFVVTAEPAAPVAGGGQVAVASDAAPTADGGPPSWAKPRRAPRAAGGTGGRPVLYPFATMEVNETFTVPVGEGQPKWNSFRVYCAKRGTKLGKTFRCHRYPDGVYEVWRER